MSTRKLSMTIQLTDGADYDDGCLKLSNFKDHAPRGLGDLIVFPAYINHEITQVTRGTRDCVVAWVHGPPFC